MERETRNSKLETDELVRRAKRVKLLLMDCDGVMTDGRIWLIADGDEQKTFHVRDGQGIVLLHLAGKEAQNNSNDSQAPISAAGFWASARLYRALP